MGMLRSASRTVIGFDIFVLLLLGLSFAFVEPGSGSFVIAVMTLVPTVLTLVGGVAVLYTGWDPY